MFDLIAVITLYFQYHRAIYPALQNKLGGKLSLDYYNFFVQKG
jgi:hypothetical protein